MMTENKTNISDIISLPESSAIFINLTNHPIEKWDDKQRKEASVYGNLMNMQFPTIEPEATTDDVRELANHFVHEIKVINATHDVTVHIMGEMTFTFSVVEQLKALGIRCLASTTKRNVEEINGQKISTFEFVQFRDY